MIDLSCELAVPRVGAAGSADCHEELHATTIDPFVQKDSNTDESFLQEYEYTSKPLWLTHELLPPVALGILWPSWPCKPQTILPFQRLAREYRAAETWNQQVSINLESERKKPRQFLRPPDEQKEMSNMV